MNPGGTGDAPTIQAAVDSASAGDEVVLAPGTYTWTSQHPTGDTMVVLRPELVIRGESAAATTILDAEMSGRAISCHDAGAIRIERLTITRGLIRESNIGRGCGINSTGSSRPIIANCILRGNFVQFSNFGAGIACVDSGAVIEDCEILDNIASYDAYAAGVYIVGGRVIRRLFRGNLVNAGEGGIAAGIMALGSVVERCTFERNRSEGLFGAQGAGAWGEAGSVDECVFVENEAEALGYGFSTGAAVTCLGGTRISNSVFLGNTALGAGLPSLGGAVFGVETQLATISGCTFYGNSATGGAGAVGGVRMRDGGTVTSSIIAASQGLACEGSITFGCCVLYGNSGGDSFCGTDAGGNQAVDPQFCFADPVASRDVSLRNGSPCAPSGTCGLIGAGAVACRTAVERRTWSGLKEAYRDAAR